MKKYLVFILGLTLFACTQQTGFKIDVNLEGAEGQIVLEEFVAGAWNSVDTAEVVDGVAVLQGEVPIPGDYYLSVIGERAKTIVFVENSKMKVVGKKDSLAFVEVTGSTTHDEYLPVKNSIEALTAGYMGLYQKARDAQASGNKTLSDSLMVKVRKMYENAASEIVDIQISFIEENVVSFVTPFLLSQVKGEMELEELDKLVNALDPKLDSAQTLINIKEEIAKLKTVEVGQIAPDFSQNDADGSPVKFSDIYSKSELTLIDFWASWCGPCRGENPNVVAVFNDYKDKGFNVFGVSLDKDKAAWLKAIEDDKLAWDHVSDLAYWQNAAAQLYAINSIPSSLLVDKNGKIVAKNKREEELRKVVSEYFETKP